MHVQIAEVPDGDPNENATGLVIRCSMPKQLRLAIPLAFVALPTPSHCRQRTPLLANRVTTSHSATSLCAASASMVASCGLPLRAPLMMPRGVPPSTATTHTSRSASCSQCRAVAAGPIHMPQCDQPWFPMAPEQESPSACWVPQRFATRMRPPHVPCSTKCLLASIAQPLSFRDGTRPHCLP